MKLIPVQYQELEEVCNEINSHQARCITFMSLSGEEGSSSLCASIARRLNAQGAKVLIIDLNPLHPFQIGNSLPSLSNEWCFSDISCQLNIVKYQHVDLLTMQNLSETESVKNKQILNDGIDRLKQEYDYILLDMSPALKRNRGNVPLHALSLCSDLTLLTVALGVNDEESLCSAVKNLKHAAHKHIRIIIGQHKFAPLGVRMIASLKARQHKWPRLTRFLINKINRQQWLFHPY